MAEVSIGDAVGAGFQLIRRRPLTVMTWGLAGLVTAAVTFGVFGSFYASVLGELLRTGGTANPMSSPQVTSQLVRMQGASLLVNLLSLFVNCVIYCAVFRAIIHPDQGRFAYLRIGAAEIFALVLIVGGYIAFLVALIIPLLVVGLAVGVLVAAKAGAVAVIVGVVGAIAVVVGLIYVVLRLSLVVPMMVNDGKFHLGDAWALTRRHAGAMLAIWLLIFLILIAAEIVVGLVMLGAGIGYLSSAAGGLSNLKAYLSQSPATLLAGATPLLLVLGIVWIPLTGCGFAIVGAPWARVYRDLSGPDLAATFS